jgi:preprotein translocase subunit SecD
MSSGFVSRWRVAGVTAVALLVAGVVLIVWRSGDESPAQPRDTLDYRVVGGDAAQAAEILRARLKAADMGGEVTVGEGTLTVTAPGAAATALTAPGRFAIYDWERSILGPNGRPAPADLAVTGGPNAGHEPALTEVAARTRAERGDGGRPVHAKDGWFALAGDPALTNADVARVRVDHDAERPTVALDLTPRGQQAFTTLTRSLAERGADRAGLADPLQYFQHLALVLDDRLVSTQSVDFRKAPDGIDGADGAFIPTPEQAQLDAALLSTGPLAATLELIPG